MTNNKNVVSELWLVVRFLLREKPAGIGTGLLFTVGLAMIYGEDFGLGIITLGLAAVWGVAAWLLSEELQKRKPQAPKKLKYAQIKKYKHGRRRYMFWMFSIPIGIVSALVLSALLVNYKREGKMLKEYEGFLLPADKPDPPSFCSGENVPLFGRISKDALKIFMGRNEAFSSHFPFVVLRAHKKDRMVIDRDETGRIALSVDILDAQGKVIITFEKGHFTVVQSNILDMKRSDRSTLIVRDYEKNEVLNVRYLNKRSLQISGLLRYPDVGLIPIPKASAVNGMCAGESGVAFDIE